MGVVIFTVGGCRKPLFRDKDDRSPYARYDSVRGQDVPPYRYNEYGRRVPNLRARLAPKEEVIEPLISEERAFLEAHRQIDPMPFFTALASVPGGAPAALNQSIERRNASGKERTITQSERRTPQARQEGDEPGSGRLGGAGAGDDRGRRLALAP